VCLSKSKHDDSIQCVCRKFTPPKRRFWKDEQEMK